jgi:hypothetical protein
MPTSPRKDHAAWDTVHPWLARYLACTACAYAALGIAAMWSVSPRVPYADQWRHYARLLTQPFGTAVLDADNGHPEVLPNLLRLADLRWFGGSEILQITSGIVLAIASVAVLLRIVYADRDCARGVRPAAAFCVVFGIFWLGNLRALTQAGDSVHVYSVLLCLALALRLALNRPQLENAVLRTSGMIVLLCMTASFSFGSGMASFVAVLVALLVQRSSLVAVFTVLGGAIITSGLYFSVHGALQPVATGLFEPVRLLRVPLQLLGAPFVYMLWPLLDPAAAAAVPVPLRAVALSAADLWTQGFGDIRRSVFPQAAVGAAMLGLTLWLTWRGAQQRARRVTRLGIALAWFGIACALLIALARGSYFTAHPEQIYALRYLPWSSLGWAGLLLAGITQARRARTAIALTLLLPVLALPSEFGTLVLARKVQDVAEDTAIGAAVGVLPADETLGETDLDDLRSALPALHDAHTAIFAWPETELLRYSVPANLAPLAAVGVTAEPVVNRLAGDGTQIAVQISSSPCAPRVLVASGGRAIGLLRHTRDGAWRGVARGRVARDEVAFYTSCQ